MSCNNLVLKERTHTSFFGDIFRRIVACTNPAKFQMAYYDTQQMEEICCWREQDQDRHLGCEFNMLVVTVKISQPCWSLIYFELWMIQLQKSSPFEKKEKGGNDLQLLQECLRTRIVSSPHPSLPPPTTTHIIITNLQKKKLKCASTCHLCTCIHIDIHIICGHRNGLSRVVKRPV